MKNKRFLITILVLLILLGMTAYGYAYGEEPQEERCKISVIVYGDSLDRWNFMRGGISQAAKDFGAEISFINMAEAENVQEQTELLEREISNGAEGILLAAVDSSRMSEAVKEAADKVPVLLVETGAEEPGKVMGLLAADDYSMGQHLGKMVLETGDRIALIHEYTQRSSVQERCRGFLDAVGEDADIVLWERGEGDFALDLFIAKMYRTEGEGRTIVALDDAALESALDAAERLQEESGSENDHMPAEIYGIGATDKIVYHLDKGNVQGIVFQNEFSIGYQGVQQMVRRIRQESVQISRISIEYYKATKENMYDTQIQGLLFPIVQ